MSKLPKMKDVLRVFLSNLKECQDIATSVTVTKVKEVWKHHFGSRVILGFDENLQETAEKMTYEDKYIGEKIRNVWKEYKDLERYIFLKCMKFTE